MWLDVEKGRDTTHAVGSHVAITLWLDVEKGRDTTLLFRYLKHLGCGLM